MMLCRFLRRERGCGILSPTCGKGAGRLEFHEKLQELRRKKGLTQEQLAQKLYVSRTAVSKWESGRGYPNIDSLQDIARFFGLTVDELISGEALSADEKPCRDLLWGVLDVSVLLFLVLPIFGQKSGGAVEEVSLLALRAVAPYMRAAYLLWTAAAAAVGLLTLALQKPSGDIRQKRNRFLSLALGTMGAVLFIMGGQPYAATVLLAFLAVKVFFLIKRR